MRRQNADRPGREEQGIALMVVIWIVGMLALQVALFNGSVRDAVRLAETEAGIARGEALTLAAVEVVAARLLARDPRERWLPDGRTIEVAYAGSTLRVRLTDERSRINLNHADEALLKGLFQALTGSALEAGRLTARLLAWRTDRRQPGSRDNLATKDRLRGPAVRGADGQPPNRTLLDPTDIGRAIDASPDLVRSLMPFVTIYGSDGKINPLVASETVLRALPDLTPQNLEIALEMRRRPGDPALLEAALATIRERVVFRAGTVVRLDIEVVGNGPVTRNSRVEGNVPLAIGGAEVIIATGIDAAAPYRILVWRLRNDTDTVSTSARAVTLNEPDGEPEKAKAQ